MTGEKRHSVTKVFEWRRGWLLREFQFDDRLLPSDPNLIRRYAGACLSLQEPIDPAGLERARVTLWRDCTQMALAGLLERDNVYPKPGRRTWVSAYKLTPEGQAEFAFQV